MIGLRRCLVLAVALGLVFSASAHAGPDVAKILVGKSGGDVADPKRGRSQTGSGRTLVIDSVDKVDKADDGWSVRARFGVTGEKLDPVDASLYTGEGQVQLRFSPGLGADVALRLVDDTHLAGTFGTPATTKLRDLRLSKVEP